MRRTLLFLFTCLAATVFAQESYTEIIQSNGYKHSVYLDLSTLDTTVVPLSEWDIAFSLGSFGTGILVNEGSSSTTNSPASSVELFASSATDFDSADTSTITERLYNDESSWATGAFNTVADPSNPFDLGWGDYDPGTHIITGSRVFFLLTRDSVYRKLEIQSLAMGTFTFRYAHLDGSEEYTATIDKSEFNNKTLAYYSFKDHEVKDLEPENWDLLFTRYTELLEAAPGDSINYPVTGILQNTGVSVLQLNNVNPSDATYNGLEDEFSDDLTTIGYDWKTIDLTTFQWQVSPDRVYFVADAENDVYKVIFSDFEGIGTGVSVISTEYAGVFTAQQELPEAVAKAQLFPNPATTNATVTFTLDILPSQRNTSWSLYNQLGQRISSGQFEVRSGENQLDIPVFDLAAGLYMVKIGLGQDHLTLPLIKQ